MFEIINEVNKNIDELSTLKELLDFVVKKENLNNCVFNIIIVDNTYIHKLNKEYRSIDRPTDVISFALEDYQDDVELDIRMLGDIYISLDKALEQASLNEHSFLREICFLSIHGLLHLLGYDHMEKEDEIVMFKKQDELLNEFGITK